MRIVVMALMLAACGAPQEASRKDVKPDNRPVHFAVLETPSPDQVNAVVATLRERFRWATDEVSVSRKGDQIRLETRATAAELGQMISRFTKPGIVTIHLVDRDANLFDYDVGVERNGRIALQGDTIDGTPIVVFSTPIVARADITASTVNFDASRRPGVAFKVRPDAVSKLNRIINSHIGHRMAIVLDGRVYSMPKITEPITTAMDFGTFTEQEARQIARKLVSDPLPTLTVVERGTDRN